MKTYDPWQAVSRDEAQRRVTSEQAGAAADVVAVRVEGRETGRIWPKNANPGPLDGQPERHWWCVATMADGREQAWGPMARGV